MRNIVILFMILAGFVLLNACGDSNVSKETKQQAAEKEETDDSKETNSENDSLNQKEANNSPDNKEESSQDNTSKEEETTEREDANHVKGDDLEMPDVQEKLMDLGYEILHAQRKNDYAFLESVLAKGATLNKTANTFYFENVSSPHEQEFINAEQSEIEYRFLHKENEESIIVGFAIVDYEQESSFTVDFQFVYVNGNWKMNDMDINA